MICTLCKKKLLKTLFNNDRTTRTGKRSQCRECVSLHRKPSARKYRQKNKEKLLEYNKGYRKKNSDRVRTNAKEYEKRTRTHRLEKRKENREKRKFDPLVKLEYCVRNRVHWFIYKSKGKRVGSAIRDLGCSVEELKFHLESKFAEGMTWANHGHGAGKWTIDHIMPLSKFNLMDRQHFLLAVNYLNLQPMWYEDNIRKSNKI